MPETYPVGMADLRIARKPDILAAYGVGSCVIVAMFDSRAKIGGLAHVMLPDSGGISQDKVNPRKFADTAVPLLLQTLTHAGCVRTNVWAKLIGGAEMFPTNDGFLGTRGGMASLGQRNSDATKAALAKVGIPLVACDIGGNSGRSLELDLETGKIAVTVLGASVKEL